MGYTFTVGNAQPHHHKDYFPDLVADWEVEGTSHPDAPTFENDPVTGNGNQRSPSYGVWVDFCHEVGLYRVFYDEGGRLRGGHPGCYGLTPETVAEVSQALVRATAKATLPPGFEAWGYDGQPRRDYNLARLIWLEWWCRWAIANCETPAISNY